MSRNLKKWVLFFLTLLMMLFLAEAASRLLFRPKLGYGKMIAQTDDEREIVLKPDSRQMFYGFTERLPKPVLWTTNSQGIRDDHPIAYEKPQGKFRVAFFGDSEVFGHSVDLQDTFEKRMEKKDPSFETVNFGVPGYNIEQVAEHVSRMVPIYHPDLVVYIANPNDIYIKEHIGKPRLSSEFLVRLKILDRLLVRDPGEPARLPDEVIANEMKRMLGVCRDAGIPFGLGPMNPGDVHLYFNAPDWKDDDSAASDKPHFIDLGETFARYPRIDGHLSAEGHTALADRLLPRLRKFVPSKMDHY